jgi:hypothetical protein
VASVGHASIRLANPDRAMGKMERPNSKRFRPQEDEGPRYDMEVVVDFMDEGSGAGGGVANFLSGYAVFNGEKLPFDAIAYGRIGGQNVSPTLKDESVRRLSELGLDVEAFTGQLQRKLVEGEITILTPEGAVPPGLDDQTKI